MEEQIPQQAARHRIDAGGRLVEEQQLRLVHQRAGQRQALLETARQAAGQLALAALEAAQRQQIALALGRAAPRGDAVHLLKKSRFSRTVRSG